MADTRWEYRIDQMVRETLGYWWQIYEKPGGPEPARPVLRLSSAYAGQYAGIRARPQCPWAYARDDLGQTWRVRLSCAARSR